MKLATKHTPIGKVISIETDENLDLTSNGVFVDASRLAEHADVRSIEVDLGKTRTMRDSGLAMLLMLSKLTDRNRNPIRLVNCRPEIRRRLTASSVAAQFQIS
jgi:anti-anti-sigma regulatory factor